MRDDVSAELAQMLRAALLGSVDIELLVPPITIAISSDDDFGDFVITRSADGNLLADVGSRQITEIGTEATVSVSDATGYQLTVKLRGPSRLHN